MSVQWQGDATPHDETLVNFRTTSFEMNGYTTAKMPSYGSGRLLNGSYSGTVIGNHFRKQTYTFQNDGTYQLNDQPVTSLDGAAKSDRGTYRLSNNTLELSGVSGKLRLTAYPFPSGGIMIENTIFSGD